MDELLESLGIEVTEEMTDEEKKQAILDKISEKDEHIKTLEGEKESLSASNEELATSVEGYKSREEKLNKDLSDTKDKLTASEAQRTQITELYKENFTKPTDETQHKESKIEVFDVLKTIAGYDM